MLHIRFSFRNGTEILIVGQISAGILAKDISFELVFLNYIHVQSSTNEGVISHVRCGLGVPR